MSHVREYQACHFHWILIAGASDSRSCDRSNSLGESEQNESNIHPSASLLCYVFRIYEDAQVNLTKLFTTNKPDQEVPRSAQGDALNNLLDLHPSEAVFYVGGYPNDFTVSVMLITACNDLKCETTFAFIFFSLKLKRLSSFFSLHHLLIIPDTGAV